MRWLKDSCDAGDLPQPQQHSAQRQGGNDAEGAEKTQAEAVAAAALAVNKVGSICSCYHAECGSTHKQQWKPIFIFCQ